MALTRGPQSNFPCPICLVPRVEMSKGVLYPLRTTATMKEVYKKAMEAGTADEREQIVKNVGLRCTKVCGVLTWLGIYLP